MSFENLKADVDILVREIAKRPERAHFLEDQLRDKLAEMRTLGLPMSEDLSRLETHLTAKESESPFENMPV